MFKKKADQGLLDSLSKLEHRDYSAATNIESIYKRLSEGRDAFATIISYRYSQYWLPLNNLCAPALTKNPINLDLLSF